MGFDNNWKNGTRVLENANVPYAYTLGNHDRIPGAFTKNIPGIETDYALPDHVIMRKDMTHKNALAVDGPSSIHGASNYVFPVLGNDGKPVIYVWMLDSSDNNCEGVKGWGCVYPDQVEWYREKSKELIAKDGRVVPGVMFHHIPMDEVLTAWQDNTVEVNGSRGEEVCCFSANTGIFQAMKDVGNIWGAFHGHDHNNDFIALYKGIRIGFGRKSGYGGYGGKVADRAGSRIIQIAVNHDGSVSWDTWIREDAAGNIVRQSPSVNRDHSEKHCCGMASRPTRGWTREDSINEGRAEAAKVCRTFDDMDACRAAAGLEHEDVIDTAVV